MTKLLLTAAIAPLLFTIACATSSHGAAPEGAHVETVQTQRLVLRGVSEGTTGSASCKAPAAGKSTSYVELKEDTNGNFALRPMAGVAVLHVTHLGTQKTWCMTTQSDGSGAIIPGEFATGVYAVDVQSAGSSSQPYAVQFERL